MLRSPLFGACTLFLLILTACDGGGGPSGPAYFDSSGVGCSDAEPSPGCNYNASGVKIMMNEDPWYYTYSGTSSNIWVSNDGIIYDTGTGYAWNAVAPHGRDSITNAAAAQRMAIANTATSLQAKYSLSADNAENLAVAMNDWSALGRSRKRTDADIKAFSQRLSGLSLSEISAAFAATEQGDSSLANQAIEKAAKNWSTSPDTMKQIIGDWFQQQRTAP